MVKMKVEIMRETWISIETIPLTKKTDLDFKNRIPQDALLWRAVYLNTIIKNPKFSIKEWGDLPVGVITTILNCIEDSLNQHNNYLVGLNIVIDKIAECSVDNESKMKYLIEKRDSFLEKIEDIENNKRTFVYSRQDISKMNKEKIYSKK